MLRAKVFKNAAGVARYLREELVGTEKGASLARYHSEEERTTILLGGKGAERLGLAGPVSTEAFAQLIRNEHPQTGERLTQRQKTNRRDGYDLSFHVPKEYSIQAGLAPDPEAVTATVRAVERTLTEIEQAAQCRVRTNGQNTERRTENLLYGIAVHWQSRPVEGVTDTQLHLHVFVINATFDAVEEKWKAVEFGAVLKNAPYYEALFHTALREEWEAAGYDLTKRGERFVPAEVSPESVRLFSRRTAQIEDAARRRGITDPARKAELGARTREKKDTTRTPEELRREWRSRVTPEQLRAIEAARDRAVERRSERAAATPTATREVEPPRRPVREERGAPPSPSAQERPPHEPVTQAARQAVARALDHALERDSAVSEKRLLTLAMKKADAPVSKLQLTAALRERDLLRQELRGETFVTTPDVLQEERSMLAFARNGRGTCAPFRSDANPTGVGALTDEQREAYRAVLGSYDRVTLLRGGAGSNRLELMQAIRRGIEQRDRRVFAFAPSGEQVRERLRPSGFESAETLARLFSDTKLQKQLDGQVLWIDQAGRLGVRGMARLFALAEQRNARVILSGDDRRHGPIERGNAFALLARDAGVRAVELKAAEQQRGQLRQAVAAVAEGRTDVAWSRLERLGAIVERPQPEAHRQLAVEYATAVRRRQKVLAVAPGRREREQVTQAIRQELRQAGRLKGKDRTVEQLRPLGWSEAERRDATNYERGQVIRFFRPTRGFRTGDATRVLGRDRFGNVWVKGKLGPQLLKTSHGERFDVYERRSLELARGDAIRITGSGKTAIGNHVLRSGATYRIAGFVPLSGDLILNNGWIVRRNFGHLAHDYCVSSYAAEDRQVDRILLAECRSSFRTASREQFAAVLGAARQSVRIFTDDAAGLRERVATPEPRLSATALEQERLTAHWQRHLDTVRRSHERSYEPAR